VHLGEGREVVVAETDIEGELRGDLPVVLNVGGDGTEASAELLLEVRGEAGFVDLADEEAGVGEAGVRGGGILRRCVAGWRDGRGLGDVGGEGERGGSSGGVDDVVKEPGGLSADGEGVLAYDPLDVIDERVVLSQGT
jgi:hypothetical protein